VALLDAPSKAKLHEPITLTLRIRNNRTTRTASIVIQLEPDPTDGFVVAGLRQGQLPVLLPGAEEVVRWKLIPVECGFVKVPKIKVTDRRKVDGATTDGEVEGEGEPVKIVDVRAAERSEEDADTVRRPSVITPILVLP
jgi:trafficking protein particle complex subunit 11